MSQVTSSCSIFLSSLSKRKYSPMASLLTKITFASVLLLLLSVGVNLSLSAKVSRDDALKASQHFTRVLSEAKCSKPFPRVVKLDELFPNSGKKFVPRCTLIHYCGEDTGCCQQENQRCSPLKQEPVTLYFWVVELTNRGQKRGIEKVTLFNDTECYCKNNSPDDNRIPLVPGFNETKKVIEISSSISSSYANALIHQKNANLYETRSPWIEAATSGSGSGGSETFRSSRASRVGINRRRATSTPTHSQPHHLFFWCMCPLLVTITHQLRSG